MPSATAPPLPQTIHQQQCAVLLQDIVRFYVAIRDHDMKSLEAFGVVWEQFSMEYLLHAGSSCLVPYQRHVVGHALSIGETYMSIPATLGNGHATVFGALWTYFVYFCQPAIDVAGPTGRVCVRIATSTIHNVLSLAKSRPFLCGIMSTLHHHGGLHVVPHVNRSVYLRQMVVAHAMRGRPLMGRPEDVPTGVEEIDPLDGEIDAYEAAMRV